MNKYCAKISFQTDLEGQIAKDKMELLISGPDFQDVAITLEPVIESDDSDMEVYIIPEWLQKEKGFATTRIKGYPKKITEKAILLKLKDGSEEWFPKSQIQKEEVTKDQSTF